MCPTKPAQEVRIWELLRIFSQMVKQKNMTTFWTDVLKLHSNDTETKHTCNTRHMWAAVAVHVQNKCKFLIRAETVYFLKEDTRLNISSSTLQSLLKCSNLSTTFSIHSDSVPRRVMYRHPLYEPSCFVKFISSFQFGSHSKRCGLPTMMSNERALVTATLNLCTESKLQCRSEAMACGRSSLPVPIHKASALVCNFCDMH